MTLIARPVLLLIAVICFDALRVHAESNTGSSRMVEVGDGVSLRVLEAGKLGKGPVLVFIPGWSTGADIWRQQIDIFAKTHRVIAFDPRSEGESTKTTSGNTPETRAQDLYTLLESFGVHRPVLIGWSQGVQDIAAYVEQYGTKELAGIVLVDGGSFRWRRRHGRAFARDGGAIQDVRRLSSASAGIFGRHDASNYQQTAERRRDRRAGQHWNENSG
jgi:microsomal epoxide hydrolase